MTTSENVLWCMYAHISVRNMPISGLDMFSLRRYNLPKEVWIYLLVNQPNFLSALTGVVAKPSIH